jgi:hypothetical protein
VIGVIVECSNSRCRTKIFHFAGQGSAVFHVKIRGGPWSTKAIVSFVGEGRRLGSLGMYSLPTPEEISLQVRNSISKVWATRYPKVPVPSTVVVV